jgi:CRISPR-associated protein Cas2
MRSVYLVCYDVADDKRLRRTYKKMRGFGDPLQYSVFRCELSPTERQLLKETLWSILNWDTDRVMLVDLGPAGARGDDCVEFWGEPRVESSNRAAVVV